MKLQNKYDMKRLLQIACIGLGLALAGAGFYPLGIVIYLFVITTNFKPDGDVGVGGTEHLFFVNETQISRGGLLAALSCTAVALFAVGGVLLIIGRRLRQ